ncbi:DUF4129 domain-containing protein [Candidatus Bipolaricaulota bacterium]|nr:DUF4129 domain-containing protein [Candidatus Bipolaricaulota bacterium]
MIKARILALGFLLIALVGLLAAGLWGVEFRGGRPLPLDSWAVGDAAGARLQNDRLAALLLRALHVLLLSLIFLVLVVFVLVPKYRRRILRLLFVAALVTFLGFSIMNALVRAPLEQPLQQAAQASGQGLGGEGEATQGPPAAPDWAVWLVAAAAGALLSWWGIRRFAGRPWGSVNRRLAQAAGEAAAELRAGSPVSDVVVRCWLRMVEILSQRAQVKDSPHLTPEELAEELSRRGFSHEAIGVLTRLFEEVRYGHKESESRREEAIAALSAIERAYG